MPNQESPDVRILTIRIRQDLYRRLERLAQQRGFREVSRFARVLIIEATDGIRLTAEDYAEIARRVKERKPLAARSKLRNRKEGR